MKTQQCIDTKILFWIMEKIVIQFSENFFNAWLEIAGERSKEISAPSWNEVNEMRYGSIPIIAFKYNFIEKSSSNCVEYHYSENEEVPAYKYVCPYQHESAIYVIVQGQEHCSIQSRYYSGFFDLRNQVLVPS
ncbi:hypothetical protein IFU39_03335 [Paenibacillus sp. CFBP 13594]|uniref:hypothetical protein n=1 Tax=Paenibacillus sp. CFBP 13594 TaxID=2774037 RepID=UPI00177D9357|nr:hypothetical protein [Paenibacillus sp. CFBP 13594]MBD8836858.1 hypothetical protein [Paenibacillus sp. CFBP 13594]